MISFLLYKYNKTKNPDIKNIRVYKAFRLRIYLQLRIFGRIIFSLLFHYFLSSNPQ